MDFSQVQPIFESESFSIFTQLFLHFMGFWEKILKFFASKDEFGLPLNMTEITKSKQQQQDITKKKFLHCIQLTSYRMDNYFLKITHSLIYYFIFSFLIYNIILIYSLYHMPCSDVKHIFFSNKVGL